MELKGSMISIGEFARLSRLTVKALRHYDEQGIMKPYVDPESGYRYYTTAQLRDARLIALLRSLEVPLPEVRILVHLRDPEQLQQALREHRAAIETRIAGYGSILSRLDSLIEGEEEIMAEEIEIKEVTAQPVLSVRARVPLADISEFLGGAFGEMFPYLFQMGARPAGPPLTIYYDPEFSAAGMDMEVCVPVDRVLEPSGRVGSRVLEGGRMASIMHAGPYEEVGRAYEALGAYLADQGLEGAGPPREIYVVGPEAGRDPAEYRTEVMWPVAG